MAFELIVRNAAIQGRATDAAAVDNAVADRRLVSAGLIVSHIHLDKSRIVAR